VADRDRRASWNYQLSRCEPDQAAPHISYHMNRLQNLAGDEDYVVTLGGAGLVDPGRVIERSAHGSAGRACGCTCAGCR
jgi:predicted NAD/FAD-binding protein